jgi:hypothetical protein
MLASPSPDYESPKRHRGNCEIAASWSALPWVIDGVLVYVDDVDEHYAHTKASRRCVLAWLKLTIPAWGLNCRETQFASKMRPVELGAGRAPRRETFTAEFTPDRYISERVKQYQNWYDSKAVSCKKRYLMMRAFTVVAGGVVPVLVNIDQFTIFIFTIQFRPIVTIVSLLVVIMVSLEGVFHYREQWKNYRSTEQALGHEQFLFLAKVGPYKGLEPETAFLLFVERTEDYIAAENSATLNIMTLAGETTDQSKRENAKSSGG